MVNKYNEMSLVELKEIAKKKGLKNISVMRKQELIELLEKTDKMQEKQEEKEKIVEKPQIRNTESVKYPEKIVTEQPKYNRPQQTETTGQVRPQNRTFIPSQSQVQSKPIENTRVLDGQFTPELEALDSGETKKGILEVLGDGYGFIRCGV